MAICPGIPPHVFFDLLSSSGRRRNKAPPPARRNRDRAFHGARPAFRPSVPDFQTMFSQITTRQYRSNISTENNVGGAHVFLVMPDPPFEPSCPTRSIRHARTDRASLARHSEDDVEVQTSSSLPVFAENCPNSVTEDDVGVLTSSSLHGFAVASTRTG